MTGSTFRSIAKTVSPAFHPRSSEFASDIPVLKYVGSDRYADSFQKGDKLRGLVVAGAGSFGSIANVHIAPHCLIGFSSAKALSR